MACEYQKDIKFDDIQVGDLVLVELFGENGEYSGGRGIADELKGGIWYFDGMAPLYRGALGYRLFRVTVMDAEYDRKNLERVLVLAETSESSDAILLAGEVRRLRKIEAGVRKMVEDRKNVVELVRGEANEDEALGLTRTAEFGRENAERLMSEIWPLEALLGE